ncbi:hypothetical protein HWV62_43834 [Athelia sp. TMB]|nr:hypothetical protein HWV62_43834 [Athelia sp. TMB]
MANTLVRRPFIIAAICVGILFFLWHGIVRKTLASHSDIFPEVTEDHQGGVNASRPISSTPPPHPVPVVCPTPPPPTPPSLPPPSPYDPVKYLRGTPTPHLKDNLRPDVEYITTWIAGGFTNDVMSLANMLYVAIHSGRVPIMPEFSGYRDEWQAGYIPFGEVFDIPQLSAALGIPILEWNQVKDYTGEIGPVESDLLGCWSLWAPYAGDKTPRGNFFTGTGRAFIHLAFTTIMEPVKLMGMNEPYEPHVNLNKLVMLGDREVYDELMKTHQPEAFPPWHPSVSPPDFQLMCFDFLYWASVVRPSEWGLKLSAGWRIARHFKWASKPQSLGEEYARRLLSVAPTDPIPPFVTVHIRRRDFGGWCDGQSLEDCFASLDTYAVRVREVQAELQARPEFAERGPFKVIVTSDEIDPEWWAQVRQRGWLFVDHTPAGENTEAKHGVWFSALIDMVIPSLGMGYVGTDASTMSLLARRRVEEWNGGVTRMVKWGKPGADDH